MSPMPMIVFRVFLLQKCGKGGRRADGSLAANGADLGTVWARNGQMGHGGAGWRTGLREWSDRWRAEVGAGFVVGDPSR